LLSLSYVGFRSQAFQSDHSLCQKNNALLLISNINYNDGFK